MHTSFYSDNGVQSLSVEQIDDELIIFDPVQMHYHVLNASAAEIWENCLDASNPADAVDRIANRHPEWSATMVRQTVDELGDLGLVEWSDREETSRVSRRTVTKLGLGVAAGAVGLPVVKSITVPSSQAAATGGVCGEGAFCSSAGICCTKGPPTVCAGVGSCQQDKDCAAGRKCLSGYCYVAC